MRQLRNPERILREPVRLGSPSGPNPPSLTGPDVPGRVSRRVLLTLGGLTIVGIGSGRARAAVVTDEATVQTAPEYFVDAGQNVIALTIDDGPDPTYTPQVLDLLRKYGVIASFCMIGEQISGNESLVSQVSGDGHMVCNHTWDHSDQTQLTAAQVADQIEKTNEALDGLGITPTVYRAPFGNWNATVFQACADANLRPVDWSVDPTDWSNPGVDSIVNNIMTNTKSGSIILEHDGGGDRSQTVAALKIVIPQLLDDGYSFTTV